MIEMDIIKVVCPNSRTVTDRPHEIIMLEGQTKNGKLLYDCANCEVGTFTAEEGRAMASFAGSLSAELGNMLSLGAVS